MFEFSKIRKMLFFKQSSPFEQTVCRSGRGQSWILLTVSVVYVVQCRKCFLLTFLTFSLWIFEGSKFWKFLFFEQNSVFEQIQFWNMRLSSVRFILFYREVLCQDSKWYLVTSLLPLEIFVSLKIRKRSYFQENSPFELRQFWDVGVV